MPNGTHVLQQVTGLSQLNQLEPQLRTALRHEGVTTLSLRIGWKFDVSAVFRRGATIAREEGKKFSIRVMAGRWTPPALTGPSYPVDAEGRAPYPFYDGQFNTVFEDSFREMCDILGGLAAEYEDVVEVLHFPFHGEMWAEISYNPTVRDLATEAQFIESHKRLMTIARSNVPPEFDVEFPMSGRGPLPTVIDDLARHAVLLGVIVQANGVEDVPGRVWGAPDLATEVAKDQAVFTSGGRYAGQMRQPDAFKDWAVVFDNAREVPFEYLEVYLPSFTSGDPDLPEEAAIWLAEQEPAHQHCEHVEPLEDQVASLGAAITILEDLVVAESAARLVAEDKLADIQEVLDR